MSVYPGEFLETTEPIWMGFSRAGREDFATNDISYFSYSDNVYIFSPVDSTVVNTGTTF